MLQRVRLRRIERLALVVMLCGAALAVRASPDAFIPAGRESMIIDLIGDVGYGKALPGGYEFASAKIEAQSVTFTLFQGATAKGTLVLTLGGRGALRSQTFGIDTRTTDPAAQRLLDAAAQSVVRRDRGGFTYVPRDARSRVPISRIVLATTWILMAGLALWRRRTMAARKPGIRIEIKAQHVVPAALQLTFLTYWGLYWRAVYPEMSRIAIQLAFAIALDLALAWVLREDMVIGLAPFPVVFSSNLFVWFANWPLSLSLISIAIASKRLLRRADGKHIFNPSAFAVSVLGLLAILMAPRIEYVDVAHAISTPPNMLELMLLLAIVVQLRFPIAVLSLSALTTLLLLNATVMPLIGPFAMGSTPSPFWPPIFLAIVLLATDPSTIPKSGAPRLLFGIFLGAGMWLSSALLLSLGVSDFFSKVFAIPFLNLLAPKFETWGAKLPARITALVSPRWNVAHVGAFAVAAIVGLFWLQPKSSRLDLAWLDHDQFDTPLIHRTARAEMLCRDNEAFCRPFSFLKEARAWTERSRPMHVDRGTLRFGPIAIGDSIGGGWNVHDLRVHNGAVRVGLQRDDRRVVISMAAGRLVENGRAVRVGDFVLWSDDRSSDQRTVREVQQSLSRRLSSAARSAEFARWRADLDRAWNSSGGLS